MGALQEHVVIILLVKQILFEQQLPFCLNWSITVSHRGYITAEPFINLMAEFPAGFPLLQSRQDICNCRNSPLQLKPKWSPDKKKERKRKTFYNMELKNKWKRIWMRMKARRRTAETKLEDTTALMKRDLPSTQTQENVGQWSNGNDCKKIRFYTEHVSEKQIDRYTCLIFTDV